MRGATAKSIDDYLAGVPEPARSTLVKVCAVIRSVVPEETTEGFSYGMPTFRYKGPLFGFAAFKGHCSLFPMNAGLIVEYAEELKGYETAKGTIRFAVNKAPPAGLIRKLVRARVAQNEAKAR
ncbi:MAG TPA: DUF1801 domain-containing protein [Bryobacteraceae bacterium]|jgi:uncharacterized protein YdhG (YjbR/CyaY superfamily)